MSGVVVSVVVFIYIYEKKNQAKKKHLNGQKIIVILYENFFIYSSMNICKYIIKY